MQFATLFKRNRQLLLAASILAILPVLFNLAVLWLEVGSNVVFQLVRGTYRCYWGSVCNPLPEILFKLFGFSLILFGLALCILFFVTHKALRGLHPVVRFVIRILLVLATSAVFSYYVAGFLMPILWLPVFGDYLLGLPVSGLLLSVVGYSSSCNCHRYDPDDLHAIVSNRI
jgi:hypothetical protein